jgi:hypothetical protein
MKKLRSLVLAVAAVAVVGTTLSSTANAGQYIGKFDYANTPARILQSTSTYHYRSLWADIHAMRQRDAQCGYGWASYNGQCYMK